MGNNMLEKNHTEISLSAVKVQENSGIIQKKHAAVMKNAKELLDGNDLSPNGINDCLNCGKLTGFINYIKNGIMLLCCL